VSTSTTAIQSSQSTQSSSFSSSNDSLTADDFLKMLIAELQNQDPLEPVNNSEIVQQVSSIREIEANQELSSTLKGMSLEQTLSAANSLIGQTVCATNDNSEQVSGTVTGVYIEDGKALLYVNGETVSMDNVYVIAPTGTS
jgi:flagellar basal-body rod modification protein FlgD